MPMHTNLLKRVETRSVSITAVPATVLGLLGDGARLPDWAPGFAPAVRADGEDWVIDYGDGAELRVRLRVSVEHGTVDILRPGDPTAGAYGRVVPNASGSEFLFTLLFPDDTDPAAIDAQMATVEAELQTVRALCEAR